jgi:hypothetical protein
MGTKILGGLANSVSCRQLARNDRGDLLDITKFLKDVREEEVGKVGRPLICNNQPVGFQRAVKKVVEVCDGTERGGVGGGAAGRP